MKVLVAGVGFVGTRAARLLLDQGHQVIGLRRSSAPQPEGVRALRADVAENRGLEQLPHDVDVILYAVSPDGRSDAAYERAYPRGLHHIRQAVPRARVVFVSSTSVYPQSQGELVDEQTPPEASSFTAERLLQAETQLEPGSHAIVRATGIYGPGRHRLLKKLLGQKLSEKERATWTNRVFVWDLAKILVFLAREHQLNGTFIAADGSPTRLGEIQDWIIQKDWPADLMQAAAKAAQPPPENQRSRKSRRIVGHRLGAAGFVFDFPSYREGYEHIRQDSFKASRNADTT